MAGEAAETPWGKVPVPRRYAAQGPCRLLVRPAGVRLTARRGDGLPCTVAARTFRGDRSVTLLLRPGGRPAAGGGVRAAGRAPEVGARVGVAFAARDVVRLPRDADPVR